MNKHYLILDPIITVIKKNLSSRTVSKKKKNIQFYNFVKHDAVYWKTPARHTYQKALDLLNSPSLFAIMLNLKFFLFQKNENTSNIEKMNNIANLNYI